MTGGLLANVTDSAVRAGGNDVSIRGITVSADATAAAACVSVSKSAWSMSNHCTAFSVALMCKLGAHQVVHHLAKLYQPMFASGKQGGTSRQILDITCNVARHITSAWLWRMACKWHSGYSRRSSTNHWTCDLCSSACQLRFRTVPWIKHVCRPLRMLKLQRPCLLR